MISGRALKGRSFPEVVSRYRRQDAALYALGLGISGDPLDAADLRFTFEDAQGGFQVMPTFAVTLGHPGFWLREPDVGADWVKLVHGEQRLELLRPLPPSGELRGTNRVTHAIDKGPDKGAVIVVERCLHQVPDGDLVARMDQVVLLRADGGWSGDDDPSDQPLPPLPPAPRRPPDTGRAYATPANLALIYRLAADPNPLHADPAVARTAGFDRPILHGLATFGIAARALIETCCDGEAARLGAIAGRFTAPVYPGETLRADVWRDGRELRFEMTSQDRAVAVMRCGTARIVA